jgi:prepilin-type N-terminal cleavage/methylation domain-containing protein
VRFIVAQRNSYRLGFTTIELLVVLAIVGLLGAIAASAVFRVRATAEKSATEQTITKLASALDVHWKAVIDAAKKDYDGLPPQIKQNLIALADNLRASGLPQPHPRRDDRARLLYVKFRLKQEFPTSFAIAADPAPSFLPPTSGALTGKPSYIREVVGKTGVSPAIQSSALLVLALKQGRSGVATTAIDQMVGSSFLRETQGLTYIIDSWGQPLQFYAFPAYAPGEGPSTTDLDVGPITVPNGQTLVNVLKSVVADPQDPEGLLILDTTSNSRWDRNTDMMRFLHPQFTSVRGSPRQFLLRRMVPVIASAGPDGLLGGLPNEASAPAAINPWMSLPGPGSFDNIYSFRLRQTGARGD